MGVSNIYQKLKAAIGNDYGVCGLMGNLKAESNMRANNLQNTYAKKFGMSDEQYTEAVDNGSYINFVKDRAGYGLAQWTYWSRKDKLLKYAQASGASIGDEDMQIGFMLGELTAGYPTVLEALRNAKSVREASDIVLTKYEKPANQSESVQVKRASYGEEFYKQFVQVQTENTEGKEEIAMKYNANNKPLVCMQTTSRCYKNTRKMTVKGVLWHSTAANNPYLKRYVQPSDNAPDREHWLELLGKNKYNNDWNHTNRQAGMNCWIGKLDDGTVTTVQTMPWNYRPWGCGSGKNGSCNNGWIQFEICEDDMTGKDYFNEVYKEACEITAYLCDMFNLDPRGYTTLNGIKVPVILCHADSHGLGLGTNHGDIYTWFKKHGKDMDDVRNDVAALMKSTSSKPEIPTEPVKPSKPVASSSYRVKVTTDALNIRKGPGTNYDIVGCIRDEGVYTIVEEAPDNGAPKWGKLKSGAGWISLGYVKKI